MTIKVLVIGQIGREIPVMPTVVATKGHLVTARGCARNADCNGIGFSAAAGKTNHICPRMHLHQLFCQKDLLGTIERGHIARPHRLHHGGIDLGMPIAQGIGAYAHDGHIDVASAVKVPDFTSLRLGEVRGPLTRQEHLGSFGQQHIATGDHLLGTLPKLLAGAQTCSLVPCNVLIGTEELRLTFL